MVERRRSPLLETRVVGVIALGLLAARQDMKTVGRWANRVVKPRGLEVEDTLFVVSVVLQEAEPRGLFAQLAIGIFVEYTLAGEY